MANDPQPEVDVSLSTSGGLGYFSSAFGFRGGIVGASLATALPGNPSLPNSTTFGDQILASAGWLQEPGQPNGDHTTHTNPYTDDILFSLRVPAKVENGFFKTIRVEFGEASIWGNDTGYDSLDATTNYFGGWSDFVTLNLSSQFRDRYGGNDYVDKDSIAYFAGGVSGSVVVAMASGGVGLGMNASKGVVTGVLVYDGIATVDGVVSSLNNAWEGKFTVWDTLSFLPVMGYGLGKIGKAFKAPGTLGDDLADASKTLENIVENGGDVVVPTGAKVVDDVGRQINRTELPVYQEWCFAPETLVDTPNGRRRIDEIREGDDVLAFDFNRGQWVRRIVQACHRSQYLGAMIEITTERGTVEATAYHPFWVIEGYDLANRPRPRELAENEDEGLSLPGRWVNSHDLLAGDLLASADGRQLRVLRISQRYEESFTVCNLTIDTNHSFAVGNDGILVHNTGGCGVWGTSAPRGVVNKNSRDFVGESHVYVIKAPDESVHKVGKSSAGTRVRDGASKRAESQVRKLNREDIANGGVGGYRSQIRKEGLTTSGDALDYEKRWRDTFRRLFGDDKLPGNREHLSGGGGG